MKKYFELLIFVCSSFIATAQNNLPPTFEIRSDTAVIAILPNQYWQMLEDKDGNLTFDEVRRLPFTNQFFYNLTGKINRKVATNWFRFLVKNSTDHKIQFGVYNNLAESSNWYIVDGRGQPIHQRSGTETPWSKKDDLKLINFSSLLIKPNETWTFYKRAHFDYYHFGGQDSNSIEYGFRDKVVNEKYVSDEHLYFEGVHNSFLFGAMLFAAIFNFFFFLVVRERVYAYFALYVFFLGFGRFNMGEGFFLLFLREHPLFYHYFLDFVWFPIDIFLALFIRSLLEIKRSYPIWDKIVLSAIFLFLLGYFSQGLFNYFAIGTNKSGWGYGLTLLSKTLLHLTLIVSFLLFIRPTTGLKRRLLFAILPSFVIWAVLVDIDHFFWWKVSLGLQPTSFSKWLNDNWALIETICLSWQVLWYSWFLLHRFVELRRQVVQKELEKEIERGQIIAQQKEELEKKVTERTMELKQSLENLKSTQAQLVQQEKMASLGELTAGIAHEIQNPLNFVNNFSEVNNELLTEMNDEIEKENYREVKSIAKDVIDNQEKINFHGKRADAIVKGMLQHSRTSSGQKEPTDINALVDEYLRLAYHGFRAKDKSFNAKFETDLDKTIEKINVVPQDIGRVLLNLINNAFYAVDEKKRHLDGSYEPCVSISTRKVDSHVEVRVKDNGTGIQQKVLDKIFQPFFTTKPTGVGTGLGLSLSYDIIKAHGGELRVETKEGEGSEFMIQLT